MNNDSNTVALLHDARGVYGIGISEPFDADKIGPGKVSIVLRPDRFRNDDIPLHFYNPALQKIVGDLHQKTREDFLRHAIHCEALKRAGLQLLSSGRPPKNWWSSSKKRQEHNRDIYYQLRRTSFDIINNLIGEAFEVADMEALKAARRFAIEYRESIYRVASLSKRALQLTDTFPALAAAIYTDHYPRGNTTIAAHMIERGVRLRDVAEYMNMPMALRRIKPGAVSTNDNAFRQHPELLNFLPTTMFNQKVWLPAVSSAFRHGGEDFATWTAKHFAEMPRPQEDFVSDVSDWAGTDKHDELITRPFQPSMSMATVTRLSAEWHEAVVLKRSGPRVAFPAPWYPAANINGYDIAPIDNSTDLHREGAVMHHCVVSYINKIMEGKLYVYSVHSNDRRVATFSLRRSTAAVQLDQLKGPYNSKPARTVTSAVRRWLLEIRQSNDSNTQTE